MARPRETDKARELALRAAAVLEREGLTISMEQLARELDLKRPTLLYHFPTLGQIIEVALTDLLLEQAAHVQLRVEAKTHPIDRLYARVLAIDEFHIGREGRLLFLTQAIAVTGGKRVGEILAAASGLFEAARRDMVMRVEQGVEEGLVHPCDAGALVALLRSVIDGLTIQRVTSPSSVAAVHRLLWESVLLPLKRSKPAISESGRRSGRSGVSLGKAGRARR